MRRASSSPAPTRTCISTCRSPSGVRVAANTLLFCPAGPRIATARRSIAMAGLSLAGHVPEAAGSGPPDHSSARRMT
jgi:hypothetical protein